MRVRVAHGTSVLTIVTEIGRRRVLRPRLYIRAVGRKKRKESHTCTHTVRLIPSLEPGQRHLAAFLIRDVLMTALEIFRLLS